MDYFDPVWTMDYVTEYVQHNNDEILRIAMYGLTDEQSAEGVTYESS